LRKMGYQGVTRFMPCPHCLPDFFSESVWPPVAPEDSPYSLPSVNPPSTMTTWPVE